MVLETLVLKERLVVINLCLWTLWAATSVVIKPWAERVGVHRMENGSVPTATIPGIANEMTVAAGKLAKLFKSSDRLICIHGSGKAVTNGPRRHQRQTSKLCFRLKLTPISRGGRGTYGYSGPAPTVVNSGVHYHHYRDDGVCHS